MEDYPLWANINAIVEAHASGTGAEPPYRYAFTRCITKLLLRRTHERVLELIKNGTLARGTLQLTMARVILGIVGVRPPTEHWALEKLGNWLKVILSREYLEPRSKLVRHKARNTARLQELDDEVIEIPWVGLAQNAGSPIVVPDTVPMHARDSRSYATPLELQKVRLRARVATCTRVLAHMPCHACRDLGNHRRHPTYHRAARRSMSGIQPRSRQPPRAHLLQSLF